MNSDMFRMRNVDKVFFMLWWDRYKFHKNVIETRYPELVCLHPVGSVGHVVYSDASEARNVNALFSCSRGAGTDFTKSMAGLITPTLCFCIRWDR
jgi:hypothetical protein